MELVEEECEDARPRLPCRPNLVRLGHDRRYRPLRAGDRPELDVRQVCAVPFSIS